jgi:signal transduction histidine kinase
MSSLANVIELPVRRDVEGQLAQEIVLALATADDLASGMVRVVELVLFGSDATRVEWWARDHDGALELAAAAGTARGRCVHLPLGRAGVLVLYGGRLDRKIESALISLAPILRRRASEERLARTAMQLGHRNQALEDFAALVAHELKTPLQAALVADDPARSVEDALFLVDALLESAQDESRERAFASAAACFEQAVEDLRTDVEITAELATTLPLPPEPLRVILRNLLSNAVAAGAEHVHVAAERSSRLYVDDDGVGLEELDLYAAGSGLGLSLCRRIAGRFGGVIELAPRASGGARAMLEFAEAPR